MFVWARHSLLRSVPEMVVFLYLRKASMYAVFIAGTIIIFQEIAVTAGHMPAARRKPATLRIRVIFVHFFILDKQLCPVSQLYDASKVLLK